VTGFSVTPSNGYDIVTIAYSGIGISLWTNRYNGPASGHDRPFTSHSLALSPDGSVFVAGGSAASNPGGPTSEFAIIKYVTLGDGVSGSNLVTSLQLSAPGPNSNTITFAGIPGNIYSAQFATNLFGPWMDFSTNIADTNGDWTVIDDHARSGSGFYRSLAR
jgi:hypothetical protein